MGPTLNPSLTWLDTSLQGSTGKCEDSTPTVAHYPDSLGLVGLPTQETQEGIVYQEDYDNRVL